MSSRGDVLRGVMLETSTTQSELSRLSGVRQPSISGFLSGRVEFSDDQLDRLLSCMGFRLGVTRRPPRPQTDPLRTPVLATTPATLNDAQPRELRGLEADNRPQPRPAQDRVTGQPHEHNLDRWRQLVDDGDLPGIHRVLTGLDRDSIQMREVSPMSGLLPDQRRDVLSLVL